MKVIWTHCKDRTRVQAPGVQRRLPLKVENGQTYNDQIHSNPSISGAKTLGPPSTWALTGRTWIAALLIKSSCPTL